MMRPIVFDTGSSLLDHWDSDTPLWTSFSPRRLGTAAAGVSQGTSFPSEQPMRQTGSDPCRTPVDVERRIVFGDIGRAQLA